MAVMTMSLKQPDTKSQSTEGKKSKKSLEKCRPITATLDHPLILDIKLLQKLDMTTFTKRGLVALSKFCGISLITKGGTKIHFNKRIKSIQSSKKQITNESGNGDGIHGSGSGTGGKEQVSSADSGSETYKFKRSPNKPKISRYKPRVNFKIVDVEMGRSGGEEEEDSDVICKNDDKVKKNGLQKSSTKQKLKLNKKRIVNKKTDLDEPCNTTIEIIPEPCKSCSRSQQPERLHSHPKLSVRGMMEKKRLEGKFKNPPKEATDCGNYGKVAEKPNGNVKTQCAKGSSPPQKSPLFVSNGESCSSNSGKSLNCRRNSGSSSKSTSSIDLHDPVGKTEEERKMNKPTGGSSQRRETNENKTHLLYSTKANGDDEKVNQESGSQSPGSDALKYVTGCYICGTQVPPKLRMEHERECINSWRNQNSVLAPEERKPEPRRPDYRFTASGSLDFSGTFESIWANHMDSLVPCKTCGRKFFPDRIVRHENCCNNLALRIKFRH